MGGRSRQPAPRGPDNGGDARTRPAGTVELVLHPDALVDPERLRQAVREHGARELADAAALRVVRRSIDARRGAPRIRALVGLADSDPPVSGPPVLERIHQAPRVAVVGAGPAGMFCAWRLAHWGVRAVVFDRGKAVRGRRHDLARLSRDGVLDEDSNYCFGEGGAGTFSDGKLYTRAEKRGSVREILRALVAYGAPPDILVDARPHIGTNRLPRVITAMREHLEAAGVEFRFDARVEGVDVAHGRVAGLRVRAQGPVDLSIVVLAPGHSARDVIDWVALAGASIEFKPLAIGVRIEHPQAWIDRCQYGALAGHPALGAAPYRLSQHTHAGDAWSFCMCPGGTIVCAATRDGHLVVNGMSSAHHRGRFANSGFVTPIGPAQVAAWGLTSDGARAGLHLQEHLEARAFSAGGGRFVAPAQTLADFVEGRAGSALPVTSYHRGVVPADLTHVLEGLAPPLRAALRAIDRSMPGFVSDEAIAVALESRTSSAVRIRRDPRSLESIGVGGLYPCGEGAGYAGGIVSAALDGVAVADAIARRLGAVASPALAAALDGRGP